MRDKSSEDIKEPLVAKVSAHETAEEEAKKKPAAPFMALFTYTTLGEKLLLVIGSLSAVISGAVFPFFLLFFADITVIFNEKERDQAEARGWELCWKFLIIGGVTWLSRTGLWM
jgi:hypothetical protein